MMPLIYVVLFKIPYDSLALQSHTGAVELMCSHSCPGQTDKGVAASANGPFVHQPTSPHIHMRQCGWSVLPNDTTTKLDGAVLKPPTLQLLDNLRTFFLIGRPHFLFMSVRVALADVSQWFWWDESSHVFFFSHWYWIPLLGSPGQT